jgi:hypothetical protein
VSIYLCLDLIFRLVNNCYYYLYNYYDSDIKIEPITLSKQLSKQQLKDMIYNKPLTPDECVKTHIVDISKSDNKYVPFKSILDQEERNNMWNKQCEKWKDESKDKTKYDDNIKI